jgi:hypothetical protein
MLNTIEQKLSAIKAINEEKDKVDTQLESLATIPVDGSALSVKLDYDEWQVEVPPVALRSVIKTIKQAYELRKQELISSAENLMK